MPALGRGRRGLHPRWPAADDEHAAAYGGLRWAFGEPALAPCARVLDAGDRGAGVEMPDAGLVAAYAGADVVQASATRLFGHVRVGDHRASHPAKVGEAGGEHLLGDLRLVGERAAFPLRRLLAPRYAIERFALVGDAAHVVHPLAGQGVNLGFLDAASLAERLADARRQGEDPGALRVLRSYERWRKGDNQAASAAFDGINRFLSFGRGGSSAVLQRGMGWLDGLPLAKRWLIARALGLSGELPEAARRRPG